MSFMYVAWRMLTASLRKPKPTMPREAIMRSQKLKNSMPWNASLIKGGFSFDKRKEIRQTRAGPVLKKLQEWLLAQYAKVLPRSAIGAAMAYSLQRWEQLTQYLNCGQLKIDNNLAENAIRPVALGRKNYLFAGSHAAAQRAAMAYLLLNACKAHQVNPFEWLRDVFSKLPNLRSIELRSGSPINGIKTASQIARQHLPQLAGRWTKSLVNTE